MDPASSYLGRVLLEDITPVVMVLSTPFVEEACQKNGLSFVELLSPFCDFDNIDVPVRTASDQPYRLQTFKLRIFYASDIRLQNDEVAVNRLKEVVINARQSVLSDLESEPPQLDKLTSFSESDVQPSWLQKINRDLAEAVSFSDHEAFDHPVACLLVVSSKDENPMNKFVDFFNTNQIPSVLNDNMDPKILKYYILLHDRQDGPTEMANTILSEIRGTFGLSDCRLLCINSGMNEAAEWREYPWAKYKTGFPGDNNACFLGLDDLNETKIFMQDLSSKKIIPHMEQKIRILNQQVSATRRGFRNQIKNLWWRKGKEDTPDAPTGPTYTFSSIESQIRVLGDYAFMLRDYELALSNYRLLSTDYKLDKAWKRYAGVQEMMGLSLFMLDQSRKDSEYCMETAFQTYVRLGPSGLRNATRCGVWWAEMLKASGQYKEAADVYFKISLEDPSLHAAVMLEQSSYCYLFANPPMLRKFGFHLVLAGNRYYISDQREHALRTYRFALSVYRENAWSYINDHVNYNIGRWYAFLGMFNAATKHMLEVLECSHQSLATQDLFLKDFQRIVQNMGRKLSVPKLQLPFINMSSIEVIFEDHRTYASSTAARVRENIWQILEENMVPSTTTKTNWLHSQKFPSKKYGDDYISVLGEPIKVYVEIKNPLRISIPISGVSLICKYSARPVKAEPEDARLVDGKSNLIYGEPLSSSKEDDMEFFELSQIDVELGGGEKRKVQLEVTPKVEGFLKIVGVRWVLSGFVDSYRYFESDVKNNRKGRRYMNSSRNNMSFVVIKGLPKLDGLIIDFPRKTFAGDLRPLILKLDNHSKYLIKNLKMMISHPRFLIPGTAGSLGLKFPNCLHKNVYSEESAEQSDIGEKREGLPFLFPSNVEIQGGKVLEWPFWLHSAVSGNISLYISLYYEIEGSFEMNHRMLRMYYELEVSPSFDLSIVVTPCADSLQEFIVRFEIASKMTAESLWLRQLSSVGCRWKLSALRSFDYDGPQLLVAGQALSCFLKLKESSVNDGTVSDMILGSFEESEPLLDVSKRPLADFHHQEKIHQGINPQDQSTGTMDFVLISQLVRDGAGVENNERDQVQLLSHHACGSSILSRNPIWLLMCGPQEIRHDFSTPFCIASFHLTVYNYSEFTASLEISTFEAVSDVKNESTATSPQSDFSKTQRGWYDMSLDTNTGSSGLHHLNALSDVATPFLWCAASSRVLQLQPMSLAKVPLSICIFSPGVYNLSAYEVRWNLHIPDCEGSTDMKWQASGVNKGRPYYFTVLQSPKK